MQANINKVQIGHQTIDLLDLPEVAQQELLTFYNFLIFKYQVRKERADQDRKTVLKGIFQEAKGKLPAGYVFDRAEIHER
ncbi:MAG: hypothetical protein CDV28_10781 [Candidatus Electronema aureum]|uniref:DUF2281 domain-containing protein n=1 Tax=Candidatus Electronema aureum TaxID=2005002 RepID=A0A521G334_9BACT|nr:MAG: hypothetical protein CDV28_10781 [Candidatus Electronema aureum]